VGETVGAHVSPAFVGDLVVGSRVGKAVGATVGVGVNWFPPSKEGCMAGPDVPSNVGCKAGPDVP
jgi:hypothetical protein